MLRRVVPLLLAVACAALPGCATRPADPPLSVDGLLRDELFAAPTRRVDGADLFALSAAMKRFIAVDLAREPRTDGLARQLIAALYRNGRLALDYDDAVTRTAAEAFDAGRGNCLSLVIMAAAFAKELGLQVTYQSVAIEDTWSRVDDIAFLNTHVNLLLGRRAIDIGHGWDPNRYVTIDFLSAEDLAGQRVRPLPEDTIVAMYMNNRAAEALAAQQLDQAYWWARAAILRAPGFSSPYNTLGVIYLRHGDLAAAEQVLARLVEHGARDRQALANLATVFERQGRVAEAAALRQRLAQLEPYPPYHFLMRGIAAMRRGAFREAKDLFAREAARADYSSEVHFWLAQADVMLGDAAGARRELALAKENSTTRGERDLYAAKLERLGAQGAR